jgi:hypothetical protein
VGSLPAEPRWHRQPPRPGCKRPRWNLLPGAVEGAEDLEVIAAAGGHRARPHDRRAGMGAEGDPLLFADTAQALLSPLREGAPIGADVELDGAALAR